jgi:hypothetical protein
MDKQRIENQKKQAERKCQQPRNRPQSAFTGEAKPYEEEAPYCA